jgi:HlyD family secretion protein
MFARGDAAVKRVGWIVGTLIGVGLASAFGISRLTRKAPPQYETTKVERGRIVAKVTATGTLSALVTVQVGSQVSGTIQALNADFNSPVKKGQLVAKIDPRLFLTAVEQAKANYLAAQAAVEKARVQMVDAGRIYDRDKALRSGQLIAQADTDTAQANYDAAKANVNAQVAQAEQAKAQLHQAQVNLDYTSIFSPTDGTVISRNVDVGQTVAASLQAPTLFTIAQDLKKMQVDTSVAEADVGKVRAGMSTVFTVDAYPNDRFKGTVRQIRNAPQTVQNVVTYDAVIDVDNSDLRLKPGMTANVSFVYAEKDDALKLPNSALRFRPPAELLPDGAAPKPQRAPGGGGGRSGRRPDDDKKSVWLLQAGQPKQVQVKVGVSDGTVTELVEGEVHEGDQLITDVTSKDGKPAGGGAPGMPGGGGGMRRGPF